MLQYISIVAELLQGRLSQLKKDEAGYSTEAVIITALLAALAIAVVGVISVKVLAKANGLQTQ